MLLHRTRRQTHSICLDCGKGYFLPKLRQLTKNLRLNLRTDTMICCPGTYHGTCRNQCKISLEVSKLPPLGTEVEGLIQRIMMVSLTENLLMCPMEDCLGLFVIGPKDDEYYCQCPLCQTEWCRNCMVRPYHMGLSCIEYEAAQSKTENGKRIWELHCKGELHFCPSCKAPTVKQKNSNGKALGCNKMTCSTCGVKWCWLCRESNIDYGHYNPSNQTSCAGLLWKGTAHSN